VLGWGGGGGWCFGGCGGLVFGWGGGGGGVVGGWGGCFLFWGGGGLGLVCVVLVLWWGGGGLGVLGFGFYVGCGGFFDGGCGGGGYMLGFFMGGVPGGCLGRFADGALPASHYANPLLRPQSGPPLSGYRKRAAAFLMSVGPHRVLFSRTQERFSKRKQMERPERHFRGTLGGEKRILRGVLEGDDVAEKSRN